MPDEDDPAGSLVDAAMLSQYVHLSARRVACYHSRTLTLFAALDSNRLLVLAPPTAGFGNASDTPLDITALALRWLTPAA